MAGLTAKRGRPWIRVRTIRARLLIASVLLVLVPVLVLGLALGIGGSRGFQQQMTNQLESVVILKEAEITAWREDLQFDLLLALTGTDILRRATVLLEGPQDAATEILAEAAIRARFQQVMVQTRRFEELMLVDLNGRVVFSTDPTQKGAALSNQAYFRQGLQGPYLQPPVFSPGTRRISVFAAQPVSSYGGEVLGVLVGRASIARLTAIMAERTGLGLTGETYLVGSNQILLTATRSGVTNVWVDSLAIRRAIEGQGQGAGLYENYGGQRVVGAYHWLPELQAVLMAEQEQGEAFRPVYTLLAIAAVVGLLGVILAVGASLRFTRGIAGPLADLAETATRIASGDQRKEPGLEEQAGVGGKSGASVEREDEIGVLARAFDDMTSQLQDLIGDLEKRVVERTRELGQRSRYLEAAAEVGQAASSILDGDRLIQQVVDLIRRKFDLDYVALFLVDDSGEWAVLRGATGDAGQAMLQRGYRLSLGGASMVAWCIADQQAQVSQSTEAGTSAEGGGGRTAEAGGVASRRTPPRLPATRTEAALPLRSRGQVIGALMVRRSAPDVSLPESVIVLQTLADQVAVALDNARLFAERQEALEAAQRAYGQLSREAWAQLLQSRLSQGSQSGGLGYRSYDRGVISHDEPLRNESRLALEQGASVQGTGDGDRHWLAIPIRVRGQVIGVLDTYKPASAGAWSREEVALLERIVAELDPALESARLYRDTQGRAARERAIRHIIEEMRGAVDIEAILQNTVVELARALGAPRAYVRLGTEEEILSSAGSLAGGSSKAGESREGGDVDA